MTGDFGYEVNGRAYAQRRRSDVRIDALVPDGVDSARSVIDVVAGAGTHEPTDREVVAVEASASMRSQR